MKIIVIGDISSGKSTFANKLGRILQLPVIHLDETMDSIGRKNKDAIRNFIEEEIKKENWIIEGNAFTKDKNKRIYVTDVVFVFNLNPFISMYRHFLRYLKINFKNETRLGSSYSKLNLFYYIPYIFLKFPKRKREAVFLAKSLGKKVIAINNFSEANTFISENTAF